MRFSSTLVLFYFFGMTGLTAQGKLTLEEALTRAVSNSFFLKSQQALVDEKKWEQHQAGAWQNPSLALGLGQKSLSSSTASTSSTSGLSLDLGLTQFFYFPGKLNARMDSAGYSRKSASEDLGASVRNVRLETFVLFYACAAASERSLHLAERLRRMEAMETFIRGRTFASPQKKAERIIVENRILLLHKEREEAETSKKKVWDEWSLRLQLPSGAPLQVNWFQKGTSLNYPELEKTALDKNPDLRRQSLEIERLKKERLASSLEPFPDLGLSAFYRQESAGSETERSVGGGVAFSLPLFNFNTGATRALDARIKAEGYLLEFQKQNVRAQLSSLWETLQASQKQIARFPISRIETLDAKMAELDGDFLKGQLELLTYLELDAQAREMHEAFYESQTRFAETLAEISKLCGLDDLRVE